MSAPPTRRSSDARTASFDDDLSDQIVRLILSRGPSQLDDPLATIHGRLLETSIDSGLSEWRDYDLAVSAAGDSPVVSATAEESLRFAEGLSRLQLARADGGPRDRDKALEDIALLGQKIVRRYWLAALLNATTEVSLSPAALVISSAGSAATHSLGRAAAGPSSPYLNFDTSPNWLADTLGIEILSSGAFPDPFDAALQELKRKGEVVTTGFENVVLAALDSPRALSLRRLILAQDRPSPLKVGPCLRFMLDLELMRLGQATTPGTLSMLLESTYRGGMLADHSTNISEQVQIIYAEEDWSPALIPQSATSGEAERGAAKLIGGYFRLARDSVIGRDHPREARVSLDHLRPTSIPQYLELLKQNLDKGPAGRGTRRLPPRGRVHTILPVATVPLEGTAAYVVERIDAVAEAGMDRLALTAPVSRHEPGLLQYFPSADDYNGVARHARRRGIDLKDGRTIDVTATANKAIEAVAGALASGQSCVKIGLLGLTLEQMEEFVPLVKDGVGSTYSLERSQRLVFIGLIDEPLVSNKEVLTQPLKICNAFIRLMRRCKHGLLLVDTMHKGPDDSRLLDKDPTVGHLNLDQFRVVCRTARKAGVDLWAAGSFTEGQVYEVAGWPPEERPGLICLGGAERFFGGLRMEPRDAFSSENMDSASVTARALVDHAADIKLFLSRENKLARDAGHVVGVLRRSGRMAASDRLDRLRRRYLTDRGKCLRSLADSAAALKISTLNVDDLWQSRDEIASRLVGPKRRMLRNLLSEFSRIRERYVTGVAGHFDEILAHVLDSGWAEAH